MYVGSDVSSRSKSLDIYVEKNVLFNDALNTFLFTVIWVRTYGKESFR